MTTSKKVGGDLTEGSIGRLLFFFAIPIVLSNLIQQLYSMVDLMVIGKFVGSIGTVGVSTGGELSDFMTPLSTAFASAGQIYIAQLVGAREEKKAREMIGTLITLMLLVSVVCACMAVLFSGQILGLLNCPAEAFQQAAVYMIVTAFGMPFVFGYNAICGVLRGMGESKRPLLFIIVAATVNILSDLLFVAVFRMEAAGAALATVLSQIGAFAAAFLYLYRNREEFDFELQPGYFKMKPAHLKVLISLAIPQLVRTTLVNFSMMWVNANVNAYGLTVSATNSVGNKLQKFTNQFMNGVDTASAAMIGQNLGARKQKRALQTVLYTLCGTMFIATCTSFMAICIPRQLFGLFTSDAQVLEMSVPYMKIMIMVFYMSAFTGALQSMVTGSGFVSLGFLIGIMDGVVCRIGFSLLFLYVFQLGASSFWWGTAFSRTIPGLICLFYLLSGRWKTRRLLSEPDD